jgi:Skp family chaperone for outer membrane proteins
MIFHKERFLKKIQRHVKRFSQSEHYSIVISSSVQQPL